MSAANASYLDRALFNGVLLDTAAVRISPLGPGFMYGEGLFETLRVARSQPQLLKDHCARLAESMAAFGAGPIPTEPALRERCDWVIAANALAAGSLKIVMFREGDSSAWSELILARAPVYTPSHYEAGFRLQTIRSPHRSGPLAHRKSLNYLANIQSKRAAAAAGFDEPLFVDDANQVLEGATTNLFLVKSGVVTTPPLSAHILPGIMRSHVLALLGSQASSEQPVTLTALRQADEVFVTNALLGVMPVAQVDDTLYNLQQNPKTQHLLAALP